MAISLLLLTVAIGYSVEAFDHGYLGVDPGYHLHISPRLRDEFGNGEQFYAIAGQPVVLPTRRADRPGGEFLGWHLDTIFKASLTDLPLSSSLLAARWVQFAWL